MNSPLRDVTSLYILDGNNNSIRAKTIMEWGAFMGTFSNRIVKQETIKTIKISTVFLGANYNFTGADPPILFETMIFTGNKKCSLDFMTKGSCTYTDALAVHAEAIKMVNDFNQRN